jgi:predicted RNA-binding protein with PIN domain
VRRVLDEDPSFRSRLAARTDEESLGRAAWLFVGRPPGWEEELAALQSDLARSQAVADEERTAAGLVRRVADLEAALRRAEDDRAAAVAELAEARSRLGEERRHRHRAETDAGRLRRRVVELEAGLDADRRRALAAERAAAERDLLAERVVHLERALDAQSRRVADLESAAEEQATSRGSPPRHEALLRAVLAASEALTSASAAVAALEGELVAGSTAERRSASRRPDGSGGGTPPDRRPVDLPPAIFDDSVEAAAHLVRVRGVTVLVDGYNVTKLARPAMGLPEQRRWLVDTASGLAARWGTDVQLVFDGAGDDGWAPADRSRRQGVQVRFSPDGVEADDVLIDLVGLLPATRPVVVATNDRRVRDACRAAGANVVSSDQFLSVLGVTPRQ